MKKVFRSSLHSSPPRDLQVQAWKLDTSPGAPQLSLATVPSLIMDGTPLSKPKSISSPNLLNLRPESAPGPDERASDETSPLSPAASVKSRRRPSGNEAATTTLNVPLSSPSTEGGASDNDGNSPWCGAVGRATLGKSGRVIERLMAEIDKLKRELHSEKSQRQEIEKRDSMNSRTVEGLRAENANLEQAKEVDAAVLKRRDRKIEELKAELDSERARRIAVEKEKLEAEKARDEAVAKERREVSEAREVAKHATSHAEVLELSHRQLATEYRQRMEICTRDLSRLRDDRDEEHRKVRKLDAVVEQLRQETERNRKINSQLEEAFDAYKEETESRISGMQAAARKHEEEEDLLREEAKRVMGEARWLINIGRSASKRSEYLPLEEDELRAQ